MFLMREDNRIKILRLDHLVLTVRDIQKTCSFYNELLGMEAIVFGNGRKALKFGNQKINLHEYGKKIEPKALNPTPGSGDLCFIVDDPVDKIAEDLEQKGINIIIGPVKRTGAAGTIVSVYLRDPDENLIELSNYLNE